jgi:hypothetical protein
MSDYQACWIPDIEEVEDESDDSDEEDEEVLISTIIKIHLFLISFPELYVLRI